jgi:type I restriction-modification system DNA methylase subunit
MQRVDELHKLVEKFKTDIEYYKNPRKPYNEHSCRMEFIDPLLNLLGWDITNAKGLSPQYREVIAENYSSSTDRPDYSLTMRGVTKFFVEAKKPSVDIFLSNESALQARKYGWNAKHKISVLTNFDYLIIYDTTVTPQENDEPHVARFRVYHHTEYVEKYEEMVALLSRDSVFSGSFDSYFSEQFEQGRQRQQVDVLFLNQINQWRVALSNELYSKGNRYKDIAVLNDVVQQFINQVVFLRICEDKNLPLYHKLQDTITDLTTLHNKLEELLRAADKRYNAGLFSGDRIVFDLNSQVISDIFAELYYPKSPYLFNIIEPNLLGKIYEMFLTEQLVISDCGSIALTKKKDFVNRSIVTTPTEIVRYMTEKTMQRLCHNKTPQDVLNLRIADIACGSGVFLESAFDYLHNYCIEWHLKSGNENHLIEIGNGQYKLPLEEKKKLLLSCIYGIDIDIHAVEVAKFSLLVKLIENETAPSVEESTPILPNLDSNILFGNSLVSDEELVGINTTDDDIVSIAPFDWGDINNGRKFDAIIGNPPYVNTEGLHALVSATEFAVYDKKYKSSHKQFDKYYIFLERAIQKVLDGGLVCYIVPNKFFKIGAGENLRHLISEGKFLVSLDDFGHAQLFDDKTIYSTIVLLQKQETNEFVYSSIDSAVQLWAGEEVKSITFSSDTISKLPWRLTTDLDFLKLLLELDNAAVSITRHAEIFNGIQTSAEQPKYVYWFSTNMIINETDSHFVVRKNNIDYAIEKSILRPYFKPVKRDERGLNSYSIIGTDKFIIFPYDSDGKLIPIDIMKSSYSGAYSYLEASYDRLLPKCVSKKGRRDVQNATEETWYQYGRTQALTAFTNTPKLIVGILSKEPMYAFDRNDMLIASGGTAGFCAVTKKNDSPYALEYLQAWLSNPYTERILEIIGSDFEGEFTSRGTFVLKMLPFVELDFNKPQQKKLHDRVVEATHNIYDINDKLKLTPAKATEKILLRQKAKLISEIEELIERVYRLEFQ